jgi:hypothetical protein
MKLLLAFLLVAIGFLVMPGLSFGQSLIIDPAIQQVVHDALPAKFASYGTAAMLAIMILGRFFTAMANGRGIKGWLSAIINGTNGPRLLIAALCLLTLPACTVDWQRAAIAATNAAAPVVLDGLNAKQPKNVQP